MLLTGLLLYTFVITLNYNEFVIRYGVSSGVASQSQANMQNKMVAMCDKKSLTFRRQNIYFCNSVNYTAQIQ